MDKNVLAPRAHPIFDLSLFAVPERNPGHRTRRESPQVCALSGI